MNKKGKNGFSRISIRDWRVFVNVLWNTATSIPCRAASAARAEMSADTETDKFVTHQARQSILKRKQVPLSQTFSVIIRLLFTSSRSRWLLLWSGCHVVDLTMPYYLHCHPPGPSHRICPGLLQLSPLILLSRHNTVDHPTQQQTDASTFVTSCLSSTPNIPITFQFIQNKSQSTDMVYTARHIFHCLKWPFSLPWTLASDICKTNSDTSRICSNII